MTERTVSFYFDYISPYVYFAWPELRKITARHGCTLAPVPVLFAGLLTAQGNIGPAEIPAKRVYVFRDAQRLARDLDRPFRCPPSHPFRPLLPLRVTSAVERPEPRAQVIDALLDAVWGRGRAIDSPETIAVALAGTGLDSQDLVEKAGAPETKAALRDQTDAAVARGVFGVPSMMVGEELFWGFDSLAHLDRHLAGEPAYDEAELQRWREVPATAGRKRDNLENLSLLRD